MMDTPRGESTVVTLITHAVREAVRDELTRLLQKRDPAILEYWAHEGPEDPEGDGALLAEALVMSRRYRENKEGWMKWEEFEAELDRAEAAGELPDSVKRRVTQRDRPPVDYLIFHH